MIVRESIVVETHSELNEGWKTNILVGLGLLAGSLTASGQNVRFKDSDSKIYKEVKGTNPETALKHIQRLLNKGWTLDHTVTDTTWNAIQQTEDVKPGSYVVESYPVLGGSESFVPGGFELSDALKSDLDSMMSAMDDNIFLGLNVEASTDVQKLKPELASKLEKMGLSGNNEGLCKARAQGIKKYLIEKYKVSEDNITVSLKPNQGSKEDIKTGKYRYTDVCGSYGVETEEAGSTEVTTKQTPSVQKNYYLSKDKSGDKIKTKKKQRVKVNKPRKFHKHGPGAYSCRALGFR